MTTSSKCAWGSASVKRLCTVADVLVATQSQPSLAHPQEWRHPLEEFQSNSTLSPLENQPFAGGHVYTYMYMYAIRTYIYIYIYINLSIAVWSFCTVNGRVPTQTPNANLCVSVFAVGSVITSLTCSIQGLKTLDALRFAICFLDVSRVLVFYDCSYVVRRKPPEHLRLCMFVHCVSKVAFCVSKLFYGLAMWKC